MSTSERLARRQALLDKLSAETKHQLNEAYAVQKAFHLNNVTQMTRDKLHDFNKHEHKQNIAAVISADFPDVPFELIEEEVHILFKY